jgi:hypothetical protein
MGVWEYGSMGVWEYGSEVINFKSKLTTLIFIFLISLVNFSVKVSYSHTPILPYSHTFLGFQNKNRRLLINIRNRLPPGFYGFCFDGLGFSGQVDCYA